MRVEFVRNDLIERHHDLLSRLLPGEAVSELELREGQFHLVVLGANAVVCFARTAAAAERLPARAAVLRALRPAELGVRIPEPLASNGIHETVRYLVLGRVPGEPLDASWLERADIAKSVAERCRMMLARFSAAGADPAVRAVLPVSTAGRWAEFADGVRAELYPLMSDRGRMRAERELAALCELPELSAAVVHGDLGGENLLWETAEGRPVLRGVIDWDAACLGDPAEDLAALGVSYGPEFLHHLLDTTDDDTLPARIATIQGTFALQQALSAHRDNDPDELADGLTAYR